MAVTYEQVRDWVLALPGGREVMVEAWGHPTLRVGDKMFAGGMPGEPTMTVKATKTDQAELVAGAPQTYAVARYVGRFGWVQVTLATADPDELHRVVVEAWRLTAPKRAVRAYDSAQRQDQQGGGGRDLDGRPDDVAGDAAEPPYRVP